MKNCKIITNNGFLYYLNHTVEVISCTIDQIAYMEYDFSTKIMHARG